MIEGPQGATLAYKRKGVLLLVSVLAASLCSLSLFCKLRPSGRNVVLPMSLPTNSFSFPRFEQRFLLRAEAYK